MHEYSKRYQIENGSRQRKLIGILVNLIPGKEQKISIFDSAITTIGRSRSCDVVLMESDISTIHCQLCTIRMNVDGIKRQLINIVDKSRNGTYVNSNRLSRRDYILKNGDKLVFGKSCSFLFRYVGFEYSEEDNGGRKQEDPAIKNDDAVFKKPQLGTKPTTIESSATWKKTRQTSVFDTYVIGKELGVGHYATVKEGINKRTGEIVAIKIFHSQLNDDQKKNKQFREEISVLLRVKHPNIVNLLDTFTEPVSKSQIQKYLILEKIDSGELFDRIVRKTNLSVEETKALFKQILVGLKYLHGENIIHRDIKPENILLNITKRRHSHEIQLGPWDEDEIDIQVKIADFGLAKFTGEMQFTSTLCGTPSYVAPEVLKKTEYSSKVDMWSAGVLLYVCLCGFPPFSDSLSPPSLKEQILGGIFAFYSPYWDEIDDSILHLISNLLVVNPSERYSVEEAISHSWVKGSPQTSTASAEIERLVISPEKIPKTYSELSKL